MKQKKFADEWLFSYNATDAYYKAYGKRDRAAASRLLAHPKVGDYIKDKLAGMDEEFVITKAGLRGFWSTMKDDISLEPKDRIRASEVLARSLGMFVDRIESRHKGQMEVIIRCAKGMEKC